MSDTAHMLHNMAANSTYFIITRELRQIITVTNYVFLCGMLSIFGIVTNVIITVVFYVQGLDNYN